MKVGDLVNWIAKDADGIIKWTRIVLYLGEAEELELKEFAKISFEGKVLAVSKKMIQPIE